MEKRPDFRDLEHDQAPVVSTGIAHAHAQKPRQRHIAISQFAGRLGGLQEFTVANDDPHHSEILQKEPDAASIPPSHVVEWLHLPGFLDLDLWKRAFVELVAIAFLTYLTVMQSIALSALKLNPIAVVGAVAILTGLSLTLLIYCAAPVSGGHMNPTITLSAFAIGMCTGSRALLYVVAQSAGGVIGAFFVRLSIGDAAWFPDGMMVGCGFDTNEVTQGQVFLFEWISSFIIVFIACGVGLDPRQQAVFGPALSPFLIGVSLMIVIFTTAFVKPGYYGAGANPARCLGLLAANHNLTWHWIQWLASISAAVSNGLLYHFIPPYGKHAS